MCGIIGYVGPDEVAPVILEGLRRLEYRGYDSAGLAIMEDQEITILRAAGKLRNLEQLAYHNPPHGTTGVGHTRWATHGAPTEANAHPQVDASKTIAVVHNGILENYASLRRELQADGLELQSDTDTELIAQLIGRESGSFKDRVLSVLPLLEGQYAVVIVNRDAPDEIIAVRQGPPLVVGLGEGENIVASDVTPLLDRTRNVVFMENGDIAIVRKDSVQFIDSDGRPLERTPERLNWDAARVEKGGYRHFMLKEIFEQPDAIRNTVRAHLNNERNGVNSEGLGIPLDRIKKLERVHLVACGTSWHSCLAGKFFIETLVGLPVDVDYASEYRYRSPLLDEGVLVIGVTQSGETADTLAAMELAEESGALLGTVCNVRGSSSWRLATLCLLTQAGPEIGVASTKAFTTQLVALLLLSLTLRQGRGLDDETDIELINCLRRLPLAIEEVLAADEALYTKATSMLCAHKDSLYLGRGMLYPIALEGALKLKEISYLHAEGYPAGEMKHGPIALVEKGFPVVAVAPATRTREKLLGNLMEVKARGAAILAIAEADALDVQDVADLVIPIPIVHTLLQPILTVIPLQLMAYHVAVNLGLDVDQPRNLAKSVTVE